MDPFAVFTLGSTPVNVAMLVMVASFAGGVIKCWSRGGMDPEWDAPTRLRYQADAGRLMRDWFIAGTAALGVMAVAFDEPFIWLQTLGPLAGAFIAGKKQSILEHQALEVEAFLDGAGGPHLLAGAGLPTDLLAELGVDLAELEDYDDLVPDDQRLDWGGGR